MGPELIGSLFAGLTGLLTCVFGYLLNRRKVETDHVARDLDTLESEITELRDRFNAALAYVFELRGVMSAHSLPVPEMPDELKRRRKAG